MRSLCLLAVASLACSRNPQVAQREQLESTSPARADKPPVAPAGARPARVAAAHVPAPDCMRSFRAPSCGDAAGCVARGKRASAGAESCDWSTLCTTANEPCKLAFVSFQSACRADDARGCYELAAMAPPDTSKLTGRPPGPDAVQRSQLLEDACTLGYGRGCYALGDDHYGTPDGDAWYRKSIALYEPACAANDAEQCSLLGYNYVEGRGVGRDLAKAASLFTKACDLGDGYGCDILGQALVDGRGLAKDVAKARSRFQRACELDPPYSGCFRLGRMIIAGGRGDVKQALAWFRKGCPDDGGIHYDCNACNALDDLCRRRVAGACGPQATRCR